MSICHRQQYELHESVTHTNKGFCVYWQTILDNKINKYIVDFVFSVYVEISNKKGQKCSWFLKMDKKNVQNSKVPRFYGKRFAKFAL